MSLEEKWNEYSVKHGMWANHVEKEISERAFYAGAQAVLDLEEKTTLTTIPFLVEIQAEIDHFRSHK